ncbi:hypothetical protein [Cytophaga aurantiaca]|uniref:hypothetical protein n=1 Tax=Cytophaga aurantiaca TaxID=29530 RepID=UPI000373A61A|nr:hypothetical protein [Cytophaga aurantiaca]
MDPLDNLLNSVEYKRREPLPEGFEGRVLDKWFNQQPIKKKDYTVFAYAAAACLVAFTCINILSLNVLNQSTSNDVSANSHTTIQISSETEFAEAYGFVETASYYTLNK